MAKRKKFTESDIKKYKSLSKQKTKRTKVKAIIKDVDIEGGYDWSFMNGLTVKLKENPTWLSEEYLYGTVIFSHRTRADMAFKKEELEIQT
jgi:hypothetical protein